MSLRSRILTILALCAVSIFFLFPRNVTTRVRGADGVFREDTVRKVPLQEGLDLKGGTYLALEVNDSAQAIPADKKADAIERALKTVRTRIEGYGVSEPIVQKQGNDRIVVEIPGIQDPTRARKLVQEQAFLQFMITDKTQALERALPRLDQVVKQRGLVAKGGGASAAAPTAVNKGLQGLLTTTDTSRTNDSTKKAGAAATKDSAANDSLKLQAGGAFSSLFQQGTMPGEFYVESDKVAQLQDFLADSA